MAYLDVIQKVQNNASRVWTPPPNLTVSQWADEHLYLSPEDSAEPGKFKVDRAPYQRGMLDAVSDPGIKDVVYCTSSQIGKTLLLRAIIGYHIHQDPGPILLMQPTVGMAESFSKDRLSPMVRDTPALRGRIADPKSRNSGNTVLHKGFPGGHITMVGANAPTELAGRPIRIVLADEVDRYPASAGTEGDPLYLARQRTATFWNSKIIMASTPTIEGASRIWTEYEKSDQRHYFIPCPECDHMHVLKWSNVIYQDNSPTTARIACTECGALYGDAEKLKALQYGEWVATSESRGVAGFHINALYSPWQTIGDIVEEWLRKKDTPETLKTFINLQLGECYQDRSGETVKAEILMNRREAWDAIPDDVVLLTAGTDCQDDRLELTLIGWTATEQARVIGHYQLYGSPGEPAVWRELDEFLQQRHITHDGRHLRIRACCIDSGGHHTQQVYEFCATRYHRKIYPIKGRAGAHPIWPPRGLSTKNSRNVQMFIVGVDTAKDSVRAAMSISKPDSPRYIAFSQDLPDEYFRQLTVERRVSHTDKSGRTTRKWVKPPGARNEAWDCFVYAMAALSSLKAGGTNLKLVARSSRLPELPEPASPAMPAQTPAPVKPTIPRPKRRRTSSAVL